MFDFLIQRSSKLAIGYGDQRYTYDELLSYTQLYANLYNSKLETIERVMFFSPNTPNYIFALYGALRIGATTVPVDVTSTERELSYMINDSRPEIIYTTQEGMAVVELSISMVEDKSYQPIIVTEEDIDATKLSEVEPTNIKPGEADDIMTLIYTSGTTGSPKGVMLTYANLWYNVDAVTNVNKIFGDHSSTCMLLPIHHIFAYAGALVAPLYIGGEIHIVESLTPESIIGTMKRGRCTILLGVPRLYETLAKGIMGKIRSSIVTRIIYAICSAIGSDALSKRIFKKVHETFGGNMDFFVSGGAALPIETATIFKNLGLYVLEGYGMTECAPMISFTRPGERAVGYCGRMLPGCEYKIEESGELCVRGANVMKGYYNRPEETASIMRDGWLHTGDTAEYDEVKGIKITGRIKEIIVTPNGKNINPAHIENEITQSSHAIKEMAVVLEDDILQALVYPDLNAVLQDTQHTLDEQVRAEIESYNKGAMSYKRIMRYQIISQELPKTRLGKIQRFKLKALMQQREEQAKEDISDRSDCYKLIKTYLDEQTGSYANGDSHFEIDLALDSLGRVSLLSYVEDSFGVSISETQLSELSTLNLLTAYVEEHSESTTLKEGEQSWRDILSSGEGKVELPKSGAIHRFMHTLLWLFFSIFYRFRGGGKENIPQGAVLFVANHRSGFDGAFVTSLLRWGVVHRTLFFAKDKHFNGGFKHFMARNNNVILMNLHTNVRESMQQMYQVLDDGRNIVIFPEGTRSKSGKMGEFKESFAILSEALNIPVVPISITGSERATYDAVRLPRFCAKIDVEFLPAVNIEQGESTAEFAKRVAEIIENANKHREF